jgi:cation diffusion facilitator CzcD-associated flavoprotein CzcO
MQDFGLSRLEVLAIIWGPTSDSGPIQSRLVDYRAIKNLVSYAKHTPSMKGSILSVYARAAPELFKDPAAAFSNLGLKFSGKAQPALTPQAATEARKRKRDGVDDNVPPSTSSPDVCGQQGNG